ncbi:unnamed protein product [Boreogadus saida]
MTCHHFIPVSAASEKAPAKPGLAHPSGNQRVPSPGGHLIKFACECEQLDHLVPNERPAPSSTQAQGMEVTGKSDMPPQPLSSMTPAHRKCNVT